MFIKEIQVIETLKPPTNQYMGEGYKISLTLEGLTDVDFNQIKSLIGQDIKVSVKR